MVSPSNPKVIATADEAQGQAMVWQFNETMMALSSAPVGGGFGPLDWIVNIGVDKNYARTDLESHVGEVAELAGLTDANDSTHGAGLLTAAWLKNRQHAQYEALRVDATVGVSKPTWAANHQLGLVNEPWRPGTINIVAQLPIALELAAAVNAIATITEAKSQALLEADIPGTGTASDAIVLCWPTIGEREQFGGTRSPWGSTLANVTFEAVAAGLSLSPDHQGVIW